MTETYCGKSCATCVSKAEMNCPGCKIGPGAQKTGFCKLAQCCSSKGHETCETCNFKVHCNTLRTCENMPEKWQKEAEIHANKIAEAEKRAPLLGKFLWILFLIIVPSTIGSVFQEDVFENWLPGLYWTGWIVSTVCILVYGLILIRLASAEARYRYAGVCFLVRMGVTIPIVLLTVGKEVPEWTLLISLPALFIFYVGEYYEHMAHSAVLVDVDDEMSENWQLLWKWKLGLILALIGSVGIVFIMPLIGALVSVVASIGTIIVEVVKIVFLYQTAIRFRNLNAEREN